MLTGTPPSTAGIAEQSAPSLRHFLEIGCLDGTMNPASSAPDPSRPDSTPARRVDAARPAAAPSPRRWLLIGLPLLMVAGYGGYLLGHTAPSGASGTGPATAGAGQSPFSGGQQGAAGTARQGGAAGRSAGGSGSGAAVASGSSGAIVAVQASPATSGVLTTTRTATGTVATTQQTVVTARASGTVTGLPVPVGAQVQAGQTVVSLSSPDLTSAVASAQNALDSARVSLTTQTNQTSGSRGQLSSALAAARTTLGNAQTTLNAQQRLYAIGAISQTDLNTARAQVQQAQSSLSSAQNAVNDNGRAGSETLASLALAVQKAQITLTQAEQAAADARVTAPFAGQVTALPVTGGQYLNAGTAAFTLTSSQRQVNFTVPPSQSASVHIGQTLTYTVGQTTYPLKVTGNAGAPVNGNVQLVAKFLGSGTLPLLGAVGSVSYPFTVAQGVIVPGTALQLDGDRAYLFTTSGGKAEQVYVTVLGQANSQAAVSGVSAGTQVIAQPPSGLLDGASVTTDASGARAGSSGTARSSVSGGATPAGTGAGTRRSSAATQNGAATGTQTTTPPTGSPPAGGTPPAGGPGGAP